MKNQKGFSLIELLVVIIIIAIIAAIAIPNLLSSRRAANEAQATANMRTINSAEQTYLATDGKQTEYGSYANLVAAQLLDNKWTDGVVRGQYTYPAISLATGNVGFCATATTADANSKSYATAPPGVIYYLDGKVAPKCDVDTGASADGIVLGN